MSNNSDEQNNFINLFIRNQNVEDQSKLNFLNFVHGNQNTPLEPNLVNSLISNAYSNYIRNQFLYNLNNFEKQKNSNAENLSNSPVNYVQSYPTSTIVTESSTVSLNEENLSNDNNLRSLSNTLFPNTFNCDLCNEKFDTNIQYEDHIHEHFIIQNTTRSRVLWSEYKKNFNLYNSSNYKCNVCNKFFIKYLSFKNHFRSHVKAYWNHKMFLCEYCAKTFTDRFNFKDHIKTHLDKPHMLCEYCCKMFNRKTYLKAHIKNCHLKSNA